MERAHPGDILSGNVAIHQGTYIAMAVALSLLFCLYFAGAAQKKQTARRVAKKAKDPSAPKGPLPPELLEAAAAGQAGAIRRWLGSSTCDVDAKQQQSGQTALHAAAGGGHGEVVRLLLEHGSDARIEDNERNTPLHAAAAHGHGLCVKMLLDADSSPLARNNAGQNSLECAQGSGNVGCVLLIQRKINVDAKASGSSASAAAGTQMKLRRPVEEMA